MREPTWALLACIAVAALPASGRAADLWWSPGSGKPLAAEARYANPQGELEIFNAQGRIETRGHAFFEPIGSNGRACVTCHQPADGMSLAAATAQRRWQETTGKDPLFAPVDGANCPSLPQQLATSHSLLLERGLIRVALPWPPRRRDGSAIRPEFSIEVIDDPSTCNLDPVYGLHSAKPAISVFRRPRVVANTKYVTVVDPISRPFEVKTTSPLMTDPETGERVSENLMSDARLPSLRAQACDAVANHLQGSAPPSEAQLRQIVAFEEQVYSAQSRSLGAGDLTEAGGPPGLGPRALLRERAGVLNNRVGDWQFMSMQDWLVSPDAFRASVARGARLFQDRDFWIRDTSNLNTLLGNPTKRACAACHNMHMAGVDVAPGRIDLGTGNLPFASDSPWPQRGRGLPMFKLTCEAGADPHPYLGRVVYTQDPGRALITGRCFDIGQITMQQLRGLAARAPYFSNGMARTLREVIDWYDQRFDIRFTESEKVDLTNFLGVL